MLSALYYTKYPEDVEAMILSGVPGLPPRQAETRFLPELDTGIGANLGTLQGSGRIHNLLTRVDNARAEAERARMNDLLAPRFVAECRDVRDATWVSLQAAPYVPLEGTAVPVLLFPDNRYGIDFPKAVEEPETSGRLRTIVGGGHDPWFEYPSAFFEAVKAFLLDVGAT
jgi:pimeloyl-ACP methyl ester carboxylesterase